MGCSSAISAQLVSRIRFRISRMISMILCRRFSSAAFALSGLFSSTPYILAILRNSFRTNSFRGYTGSGGSAAVGCVSVASLWEIAIKTRIGKLDIGVALERIPSALTAMRPANPANRNRPRPDCRRAGATHARSVRPAAAVAVPGRGAATRHHRSCAGRSPAGVPVLTHRQVTTGADHQALVSFTIVEPPPPRCSVTA